MKKLIILFLVLVVSGCGKEHKTSFHVMNPEKLLTLHNQNRKEPLRINMELYYRAQDHARWMAKWDRLQHSDLKGFSLNYLGENIAWNQENEEQVVRDWMNSRGHRANIQNSRFTDVGFGYATNDQGEPYWCAIFGGSPR